MSSVSTMCVLVASLMPIVCAGIAKSGTFSKPPSEGGYDNNAPREWMARQHGWRQRANAAQSNCFEALPFFIGAVLLAQQAGADQGRVDALAVSFIVLRSAYIGCYLGDRALARSVLFIAAFAVNVTLLLSGV
ncbi:MAG: hypothetical protein B7Y51_08195 [Burkholderiales bacterium 28-67-8]|nr:MAG: hypothetical protein B7Y51_08195 [Burkholderiales bacterium 28-67-8]